MKTIEATAKTPQIMIDNKNSLMKISGKLIPENPKDFFTDFNKDAEDLYLISNKIELDFSFDYFNTSAAKYLSDFFKQLKIKENVTVKWFYETDDEDMLESGELFAEMAKLKFEMIQTY